MAETIISGFVVEAPLSNAQRTILTPAAAAFLAELHRAFDPARVALLAERLKRQAELDTGARLDFPAETASIRDDDEWTVAPIPQALLRRTVELTGPVDRKMVINGLNSGADAYMADFEDSSSPTWDNMIQGQINLRDAVNRTIELKSPDGGHYRLNERTATLLVRPRGWRLPEKHALVDGEPMSGALFDFGLYFFHNARDLLGSGSGPYFHLPKLQSYMEARLWNEVFLLAQERLGIPRGSIKATVLIETLPAVFQLDEILWELREHVAGLGCDRWNYIFSYIKTFRNRPGHVLPDRDQLTMLTPFLRDCSRLVIRACHRRGAYAMGVTAAQIPIKDDPEANGKALAKVRADKGREATDGHDGARVAHPGLVATAREAFERVMTGDNQLDKKREDVNPSAADLQSVPEGNITLAGLARNTRVALLYLEAWLRGTGCVPIDNLMEDAATAEVSRAQIWQWIKHPGGRAEDGTRITRELFRKTLGETLARLRSDLDDKAWSQRRFDLAAELLDASCTALELPDFITLQAYGYLD